MNRQELIAAYALGELEGAERERFERDLAADPALRAEVEATRGTMATLEALPGDAWPAAAMPSEDAPREAEAAAVGTVADGSRPGRRADAGSEASNGAGAADARPRWRFGLLRPAPVVAMVLVAAVLGGVVGALIANGGDSSSAPAKTVLVLHPLDAPKDSRADLSMPDPDTMLLRTHGLPPSAAGDYYEVWLMSNNSKIVPVASFRVGESGEASVEVPLPAAPAEYTYFDVSRQTVSGGLHHSSDSVLRGATAGLGA
jgi:anti-sigma-K factor RskA